MLQEAIITNIREDGLAEVVVERLGICGGDCEGCDGCQYENLMKSVVQNPIGARRGQHVMIETPTMGVVKGALWLYVLPIVLLVIGYYVAAVCGLPEGKCILSSMTATVIGILIAVVVSKKTYAKDPTPTQIVSIIDDQN